MHGNRLLVMEALVKVFALEHLRDRVFRCQTYEILGGELREPPAVEVHHRFFRAENLENLRLVGLGVLRNLLPRQRRPRRRAPRWIAIIPVKSPMRKMTVWPRSAQWPLSPP